jgi:hypothetical protein
MDVFTLLKVSQDEKDLEIIMLRQQVRILQRKISSSLGICLLSGIACYCLVLTRKIRAFPDPWPSLNPRVLIGIEKSAEGTTSFQETLHRFLSWTLIREAKVGFACPGLRHGCGPPVPASQVQAGNPRMRVLQVYIAVFLEP